MIEGDTALTPDQGPTAGSSGIMRGGVQMRQAAATAREALIALAAAAHWQRRPPISTLVDGEVRPKAGGAGIAVAELVGDKRFDVKMNPKAKLKRPGARTRWSASRCRGPTSRPRSPAAMSTFTTSCCRRHAARARRAAAGGRREARVGRRVVGRRDCPACASSGSTISSASSPPTNGLRSRRARAQGALERQRRAARRTRRARLGAAPARSWRRDAR